MKLSIIIPVRGSPNELWFTLQSLCIHQSVREHGDVEIIVADNDPVIPRGKKVNQAEDIVRGLNLGDRARWIDAHHVKSPYYPRDTGAAHATGDWLLFLDSHVLLSPGFIAGLLDDLYGYHPETITHYPVTFRYPTRKYGHYDLESVMTTTFWGLWKHLARNTDTPYPIGASGIWAYCVRRDFYEFIGGFNPHFEGYSGGEPYLDLKAWNLGAGVFLDPRRHGAHWSGPRSYSANYKDRVRNFALAVSVVAPRHVLTLEGHYKRALPTHRMEVPGWIEEGRRLGEREAKDFAGRRRFATHDSLVEHWRATGVAF